MRKKEIVFFFREEISYIRPEWSIISRTVLKWGPMTTPNTTSTLKAAIDPLSPHFMA